MLKRRSNQFDEQLKDLGFGSKVAEQPQLRLLNHDGSFNVERTGLPVFRTLSFYHSLITMPWWRFHLTVIISFFVINSIFSLAFLACGDDAINGVSGNTIPERFVELYFFSMQTFSTVGYGHLSPNNFTASFIAAADAFIGLLAFALATGLLFARFSRPTAKVMFSDVALIAPYRKRSAFEFRIANERNSQLIEVEIKVIFTEMEWVNNKRIRRFRELELERKKVAFLPLHLTVVHPIDENSPLFNKTKEELCEADAEFLILITAIDDIYSHTVHARSSYKCDEIVWNARFDDMFLPYHTGHVGVDLRRLHSYEQVYNDKE